jgi:hypothetical protein
MNVCLMYIINFSFAIQIAVHEVERESDRAEKKICKDRSDLPEADC